MQSTLIPLTAMLADAFTDSDPGVYIKYCTDGGLFNLQLLNAKTKVHYAKISDLLFADNCALNAMSETNMQSSLNRFSDACDNVGLTIRKKKQRSFSNLLQTHQMCLKNTGCALKELVVIPLHLYIKLGRRGWGG